MGDDSDFPQQSSKIVIIEEIEPITFGILNLVSSTEFLTPRRYQAYHL